MEAKDKYFICLKWHPFSAVCMVAIFLLLGLLTSSVEAGIYVFTGSETTVTLSPGVYNIAAYGAQGGTGGEGTAGGLGAEMEGRFSFSASTTLTLLVGGGGVAGYGGGGGGGSFVVNGSTPMVIAGGGGGGGYYYGLGGGSGGGQGGQGGRGGGGYNGGGGGGYSGGGGSTFSGGGGGGYSGGGGGSIDFGGGGGGSIIDSSAIMVLTEISGVASPDGSPNGEIIITAVPEPTTLALAATSVLSLLLFRRQRK